MNINITDLNEIKKELEVHHFSRQNGIKLIDVLIRLAEHVEFLQANQKIHLARIDALERNNKPCLSEEQIKEKLVSLNKQMEQLLIREDITKFEYSWLKNEIDSYELALTKFQV